MQAPTPEFTDVGASLFAGVMLQLLQYVKGHTLFSLLVHIAKLSFRWQQERHAKGYALFPDFVNAPPKLRVAVS